MRTYTVQQSVPLTGLLPRESFSSIEDQRKGWRMFYTECKSPVSNTKISNKLMLAWQGVLGVCFVLSGGGGVVFLFLDRGLLEISPLFCQRRVEDDVFVAVPVRTKTNIIWEKYHFDLWFHVVSNMYGTTRIWWLCVYMYVSSQVAKKERKKG